MTDTLTVLKRLKARLGRERGRARRMWASATGAAKERPYVENYMCSIAMSFIDDEIRKLKKATTHD